MPLPPDYHIHTPLCRHAEGQPVEYAAQAVRVGLEEIGFADHSPMARDDFDDWRMRLDQLDEYVDQVRLAQNRFPQLNIRLGLEVDFLPGCEDWVRQLAARHPWDYLIGSVHYVTDQWAVDHPGRVSEWKNRDPLEVWTMYLDRLTQAAASGQFDFIGHIDLPKKFGCFPPRDCAGLFRQFFAAAREHDQAIELNTGGLRKDCAEIYPGQSLVREARRFEIPITFGSDAHAPVEVGSAFDRAVESARGAGYTHCCRFIQRRRELMPL